MIFSLFWEGRLFEGGAFIRGGAFILKSEILGGRLFEAGRLFEGAFIRGGAFIRENTVWNPFIRILQDSLKDPVIYLGYIWNHKKSSNGPTGFLRILQRIL